LGLQKYNTLINQPNFLLKILKRDAIFLRTIRFFLIADGKDSRIQFISKLFFKKKEKIKAGYFGKSPKTLYR
jgi:hypothetical protein